MKKVAAFSVVLFAIAAIAFAHDCPLHHGDVDSRGDAVMGFEHAKSTHHFLIKEDGGSIEAEAKDANDLDTISKIRSHFAEIAKQFFEGNFEKPHQIHEQTPPGASRMIELRKEIEYRFEETEAGGRVRIVTQNPDAIKAIHEFLRFQIQEHHTGD